MTIGVAWIMTTIEFRWAILENCTGFSLSTILHNIQILLTMMTGFVIDGGNFYQQSESTTYTEEILIDQ